MLLDKQLMFSEAQAVTTDAASGDTVDLGPLHSGNTVRDIGVGTPVTFLAQVTTAATAAGAAKVTISLETAKTSDFAHPETLLRSGEIPVGTLKQGYRYLATLPQGVQRYLRVNYTVKNGPLTAGAFTAGLALTVDSQHSYATASRLSV